MKIILVITFTLLAVTLFAQQATTSPLDPISFGVVLDDPEVINVQVKKDIIYLKDSAGSLGMDIYLPPKIKADEIRPAIIFLNAIGDRPGERKIKSWGIYTSWPKLMAAKGFIGISMETDGSRVQESIRSLFSFLQKNGSKYNIDANKLGVYAASANVRESVNYLMNDKAYNGIKAAVLYYGGPPQGPFRKDLPVLFVISEGDVARNGYGTLFNEVLKNNAPWTIKMGTGMPHAFDAFSDDDEARKIIRETIAFWKNHLDPVPAPSWSYSKGRDVLGSIQMNRPKAMKLLKELSAEHPDDVNTLTFYADALSEAKNTNEAKPIYQKVLRLQPDNVQALMNLAVLSYIQNNPTEAESYISTAVNSGKMTFNSYSHLGFLLLVANKNKEAAMYYEKVVALQPHSNHFYNLACAYAKDGILDKALLALENTIKYGGGSKQQWENDPDLDSLKKDDRYKAILNRIK
jgi:tetratricopeptide (TPR) repeat protein